MLITVTREVAQPLPSLGENATSRFSCNPAGAALRLSPYPLPSSIATGVLASMTDSSHLRYSVTLPAPGAWLWTTFTSQPSLHSLSSFSECPMPSIDNAENHGAMSLQLDTVLTALGRLTRCVPIAWWVGTVAWRRMEARQGVRATATHSILSFGHLVSFCEVLTNLLDTETTPTPIEAQRRHRDRERGEAAVGREDRRRLGASSSGTRHVFGSTQSIRPV